MNLLSSSLSDEELSDSEVPTEETVLVQVGDLYQCGEHHLMCGDSTNPDHLAKLLAGQSIDLYLTSQPSNNNEQMKQLLIQLGYDPTNEMALALVVLQKALNGDMEAFSQIQQIVNQNAPTDKDD